jgi:hypothetical protein
MESGSTVIIPFYKCVLIIRTLNCADFSVGYSEIPQTLNPIPGIQFLGFARGTEGCSLGTF